MNYFSFRVLITQLLMCGFGWLFVFSQASAGIAHYTYDDLNRVIMVDKDDGSSVAYTYDDMGNRLTKVETAASIVGKVLDEYGNPITDVCVYATAVHCGTGIGSGRSNADGTYSLDLPPGDYFLGTDVTCSGSNPVSYYVDAYWNTIGGTLDCSQAESVTVTAGQATTPVTFNLEKGGILSGTLYQEDGVTPITGQTDMEVSFYTDSPCNNPAGFDSVPVDPANGQYQSYAMPVGPYFIRVYPGSSHYISEWWADPESTPACGSALSVNAVSGQNIVARDFQLDSDSDGDGLSDALENTSCTDANDADSDDDGIADGIEDANHNGLVDAGETNPCNVDSDGDGIQDGTEIGLTMADIGPDTDLAVFIADQDPATVTNPLNPDTDNDGIPDGQEDANHNGRVDNGETDPLDSRNNTGSKFFIFKSSNGKTIIINL